ADSSNLDKDKSALTADPLTIVANNTATSALKLTLKDANGNLVSGQTVLFSTELANTTFSTVKDNQDGTYTATLKGTKAGDALLKVTVNGTVLEVAPVTVKLTADSSNLDKDKSSLTATPLTIVANNTTTSEVKLTLKDANDNPVSGQTLLFSTTLANTTFGTVTDNHDGTYTATLKGKTAGDAEIKVTVGGNALEVAPVTVKLTADSSNLDKDKSMLTATPLTIVANNTVTSVLTLTLKDVNDNPVAGQSVLFSTGLADTTFSRVTDNQDGTYTATLKGTKAGNALLKVTVNGTEMAVAPVTVTLTGDKDNLDKDKSTLAADPLTIVADGNTTSALTLTLKDVNGNAVSGQTVLFSTDLTNTTFSAVTDNHDGTYTGTLKGTTAGVAVISVTVNGTVLAVAPVTVQFEWDIDENTSTLLLEKNRILNSNGYDTYGTTSLELLLIDSQGNSLDIPVSDINLSVNKIGLKVSTLTRISEGKYQADITSESVDNYEITVAVANSKYESKALLGVYTYNFYIPSNELNIRIIPNQVRDYHVYADASDNQETEINISPVSWSSSEPSVAEIATTGRLMGKASGTTNIKAAAGSFRGISFSEQETTLVVRAEKLSPVIGAITGSANRDVISPPEYKLYYRSGDIIDGIGSTQAGGGGEGYILNLDKVTKVEGRVCSNGHYYAGVVVQMKFVKQEGTQVIGPEDGNPRMCPNTPLPDWEVPEGSTIVGINTWGNYKGLTAYQWIYYEK
ncbi:TPA: Ig-like domain-containing protein, partial [Morganella morganii]|nr:Ig-like domain-containing protein [Morganella morganii]